MPAQPREYERLPGSGFYSEGRIPVALLRSRLYLFGDHLLRVENSRFTEKYRRFYLADIQSIVSVETKGWLGWLAFWFVLLLCALPGIYFPLRDAEPNWGLAIFLGWPAPVFLFYLLRSLWRGRSCRTEIQTAGGREIVPSLSRVRSTRRALAKILPAIAQAQAGLPEPLSDAWRAAYHQLSQRTASSPDPTGAGSGIAPPPLRFPRPSGWLLWPTPTCTLLTAAAFLLYTFTDFGWFLVTGFTLGVIVLIPAFATVIRLPSRLIGGLRGINIATVIIAVVIGGTFYIEYIAATVKQMAGRMGIAGTAGLSALAEHPPFSATAQLIIALTFAVLTGLAGIAALLSAFFWRQRNPPRTTSPS